MKVLMDETSITRSLTRITHEILERNKGVNDLVLFGIKTRGAYLAKRIGTNILSFEGSMVPVFELDIRPWRDDLKQPEVSPALNFAKVDIEDKIVVLVDDVLFKGRTVRAALTGILSIGRPRQIQLAVLIDRGHRELPIRADYVGKNIPTAKSEEVKLHLKECDNAEEAILL
ncbi:MAG: bifunctional pyr operon transcriptional regulator/uracil phosphoribosyltransferase PyrR [Erysipelotrichaceae bacterium]|jgi:pyrimidine operon attenuation protein/uracil phosphoribosyltransferase|nr:bifunctional pyr operon transcriptional regulator/uracil phosphoribosyltransferase PyrR [Erysipelotrichaceae bacterium]